MDTLNPYTAPASMANGDLYGSSNKIDQLDVSPKWKERFHLIEKAGGPAMPEMKQLTMSEMFKVRFNVLAVLFGLFYYIAKGMWKKGLVIAGLATVAQVALLLTGLDYFTNAIGIVVALTFSLRAGTDYYKKMVLNDNSWW